ncbi:hypothetical protein EDB83DRAFT_2312232 [Lactarius deliciosus]|nr:hypothetical protein EDB83DRAFT_2312232 [Lactarius deliciosus]
MQVRAIRDQTVVAQRQKRGGTSTSLEEGDLKGGPYGNVRICRRCRRNWNGGNNSETTRGAPAQGPGKSKTQVGWEAGMLPCALSLASQSLPSAPAESLVLFMCMSMGAVRLRRGTLRSVSAFFCAIVGVGRPLSKIDLGLRPGFGLRTQNSWATLSRRKKLKRRSDRNPAQKKPTSIRTGIEKVDSHNGYAKRGKADGEPPDGCAVRTDIQELDQGPSFFDDGHVDIEDTGEKFFKERYLVEYPT